MKKILFLTDFYYPNKTSIGACIHELALELVKEGYQADVLCFGMYGKKKAEEDHIEIYFTPWRIWDYFGEKKQNFDNLYIRKLLGIIEKISCRSAQILHMACFPCVSNISNFVFARNAMKLYEKNKYDMVVSSYAPFEAVYAGYLLKRKYNDIHWVNYVLDTFSNRGKSKYFSKKWNEKHGYRWERKFWDEADAVLLMECHRKHHMQKKYAFARKKIHYTDIPLFGNVIQTYEKRDDGVCRILYAGRIDREWYSPEYMCELLCALNKKIKFQFDIYGDPGDCEKYLTMAEKKTEGAIAVKGFVPRKEIQNRLAQADVFVCFGHKESGMVQSKIFDYMSAGKRIVHIKQGKNDSAMDYYKRYDNVLVLDIKNDFSLNAKKLKDFLLNDRKILDMDDIRRLFRKNTPAYTADILKRYM